MRNYIEVEEIVEEVEERLPELLKRMLKGGFSNYDIISIVYDVISEHIRLCDVNFVDGEDIDAIMTELGVMDYYISYDGIMSELGKRLTDWLLVFECDDEDEDDIIGIIIRRK